MAVDADKQRKSQLSSQHLSEGHLIVTVTADMKSSLFVGALAASVQATVVTNDTSVATNRTFDYVVVGAGLTGITVANKLSGKGFSTLIIEAGPDARWNNRVYNAEDRVQHDPYCNWLYPAYDEDGSLLPSTIDSGACIGGSTSSRLIPRAGGLQAFTC